MDGSAPARASAADTPDMSRMVPPAPAAAGSGRHTLALRLAQRGRLRELRAERLARIRASQPPIPAAAAPTVITTPASASAPAPMPVSEIPASPVAGAPASVTPASSTIPASTMPAISPNPATAEAVAQPAAASSSAAEQAPALAIAAALAARKAAQADAGAALEEFLRALTGRLAEPAASATAPTTATAPTFGESARAIDPQAADVLPFQRREAGAPATAEQAPQSPELLSPEPETTQVADQMADQAEARPEPAPTAASPVIEAASAPGLAPETASEPGLEPAPELPAASAPAPETAGLAELPGVGPGLVWALERAGIATLADLAALEAAALAERLGPIGRLVPAQRWIDVARTTGA